MTQEAEEKTFLPGTPQEEKNCFFFFLFYTNVLDHEGEKVTEDMQILCSHLLKPAIL